MRLINVKTAKLDEFLDSRLPKYAILSHTWGDDEVTFQDMENISLLRLGRTKPGHVKIRSAVQQALMDGLSHIWVDTCCIDKRSSAELQEAINSMFRYYEQAHVCYVYMTDIPGTCPPLSSRYTNLDDEVDQYERDDASQQAFLDSRWFTRGWTLQELIAPRNIVFFGSKWNRLGMKEELIDLIHEATRIEATILTHTAKLTSISIAQRMSWAAHRQTSRIEDKAYCLLGIFSVNMPMLYGEGSKAFVRLQEEILKTSTDHSIFAWDVEDGGTTNGDLLAASPSNFARCHRIVQWGKTGAFEMTNRGLRISLPTLRHAAPHSETLAILRCRYANDMSRALALRLNAYGGGDEHHAIQSTEPSSRLMPVRVQALSSTKPSTLQITRTYESEATAMKFWVPLFSESFQIVDVYPKDLWNHEDGIMLAPDGGGTRGGIVIKSSTGAGKFVVAFGFDVVPTYETNDNDGAVTSSGREQRIPGIYSARFDNQDTGFSHQKVLRMHVHKFFPRCVHDHKICLEGRCPYMNTSEVIYEWPHVARLDTKIRESTAMNEIFFIVDLEITEVHELHTEERAAELGTMDDRAYDHSTALRLDSYTESMWKQSLMIFGKQPIQLLMRVPPNLCIDDQHPPGCQKFGNRFVFWSAAVRLGFDGAVELSTSTKERLGLAFCKSDITEKWHLLIESSSNLSELRTVLRQRGREVGPIEPTSTEHASDERVIARFSLPSGNGVVSAVLHRTSVQEDTFFMIDVHLSTMLEPMVEETSTPPVHISSIMEAVSGVEIPEEATGDVDSDVESEASSILEPPSPD